MQVMEETSSPASLIPTITSHELQELDDLFWLKLGIEHCNMRKWVLDIVFMLQTNLGKSDALVKLLFQFHTMYTNLSCVLDDIICDHYPLDVTTICVPSAFRPKYDDEDSNSDTIASRTVIGVFYRSNTMQDYSIMKYIANGRGKHYCGYISPRDMQYMTHFITRHEGYLEYLNRICDAITKNKSYFRRNLNKKIADLRSKNQRLQELLLHVHVNENYVIVGQH